MSDKFSAYDILFVGKPIITELSGRVMLSGVLEMVGYIVVENMNNVKHV